MKTLYPGSAFRALLLLMAAMACPSCIFRKQVPPDPAVVEAYTTVDSLMQIAASGEAADMGFADELSEALDALMKALAEQKPRYSSARQGAELHKLVIELGDLYAQLGGFGYDEHPGAFAGIAAQWDALKPRLEPFVGEAGEK